MAAINASACACYRTTVRAAADLPADLPPSLPARVTLPKLPNKKPVKWTTGTGPGEYGGPPTTTGLRKYWGGGDEDPVTATDDFIWNKEFVGHMQRFLDKDQTTPNRVSLKEHDSGFLSLTRALSLDSIDIDLSEELRRPQKSVLEQHIRNGLSATKITNDTESPRWRLAPTRREQAKWDRASKAATDGTDVILRESMAAPEDPKVLAAQSREKYIKLKQKLQVLTAGIGGIGVVSAYFSYSPEIAASFGAGLLGSLVYIRLLGKTVDSIGSGSKGLMKGAVAQPRLLIPVVLVMMYNRWNEIFAPHYGLMHLELIPMLVGFFTYKVATFVQAVEDFLNMVDGRS